MKILQRLKMIRLSGLAFRLIALFMVMAVIVAISGGIGIWSLKKVSDTNRRLIGASAAQTKQATLMKVSVQECRVHLFEAALQSDKDSFEMSQTDYELKRDTFKGYTDILLKGNPKLNIPAPEAGGTLEQRVKAVQAAWTEFEKTGDGFIAQKAVLLAARSSASEKKLNQALQNEIPAAAEKVKAAIDDLLVEVGEAAKRADENATGMVKRAIITQLAVVLSAMLIAALLGVVATRSIVSRLRRITDRLKDIAAGEGDLTKRIEVSSKDEFGELAGWFNTFLEKLRDILREVAGTTENVSTSARQLADTSGKISSGVAGMGERTSAIATAGEQMSQTIMDVARNCSTAAQSAAEANSKTISGGKIIHESVVGMRKISEMVKQSSDGIGRLGSVSDQIGKIVTMIGSIADRTNLLALNAAIEAARAGEQGRGFAVVADEVRALSESTAKAVKEISGMITVLRQETASAMKDMEQRVKDVNQESEKAAKSSAAIEEISTLINAVSSQIEQIATAIDQQSATTSDISRNIKSIDDDAQASAKGAKQSTELAREMTRLSELLQAEVGKFKL